jgi:high affinity Mn2+ porin
LPFFTVLIFLLSFSFSPLNAQDAPATETFTPEPWNIHYQATFFPMYHGTFAEQYAGNPGTSLADTPEFDASITSTIFFGIRLWKDGAIYIDPELAAGSGFSNVTGIAGFPNGEIYRVASPDPKVEIARVYFEQVFGLGGEQEVIPDGQNQLAEKIDVSRITFVGGKFSLTDFFDQNTYNGDPRNQFSNWALWSMGSWDYSADTEGYIEGLYWELNQKVWAFRIACVTEPQIANGNEIDQNFGKAHAASAELEYRYQFGIHPGKIRLGGFINSSLQGLYSQAIAAAAGTGNAPVLDNSTYHDKPGVYLDAEQELGQDLGLFARAGLQDGDVQEWAFAPIDQSAQLGFLLSGSRWNRPGDQFGFGYEISGISSTHQAFLEEGGQDFNLGDGSLTYGPEEIIETYYNYHPSQEMSLTLDFQYVTNPAYNQARGPVDIFGLRCHFEI